MIEFNLLPDVKIKYLKTKHIERLVTTVSIVIASISFAIFVSLLLFVDVYQKVHLSNLTNQINTSSSKLASNKNLNQILTVQKQLETIPKIEAETPTTSRVFGYISQLTPSTATISTLNVSFSTSTITITGGANSLATVNTYVDTLKYATYNNTTNHTTKNKAFSSVVLSSFNYSSNNSNSQPAQYSITAKFDPALFNSSDNITLVVPKETTTRSILNQPTLFKASSQSTTSNKTG